MEHTENLAQQVAVSGEQNPHPTRQRQCPLPVGHDREYVVDEIFAVVSAGWTFCHRMSGSRTRTWNRQRSVVAVPESTGALGGLAGTGRQEASQLGDVSTSRHTDRRRSSSFARSSWRARRSPRGSCVRDHAAVAPWSALATGSSTERAAASTTALLPSCKLSYFFVFSGGADGT